MNEKLMPVYYVSHGGGPWPWLKNDRMIKEFKSLKTSFEELPNQLPNPPKAILMISAHWEEDQFQVSSSSNPEMIYDYTGFPLHTYEVKYPAPGNPILASSVQNLLAKSDIKADLNPNRGLDHGTFVPLAMAFPEANIPIVQVSLKSDFDPEEHFRVGQAIKSLRKEGVLIIGSGMSYHNMRGTSEQAYKNSHEFDQWLQRVLIHEPKDRRLQDLKKWDQAPSARFAHPREDHLIPLMVIAGAADGDDSHISYHEGNALGGFAVSSFKFG